MVRGGVLGGRSGSIEEAHFLLTFSEDVTYLPMPDAPPLDGVQLRRAREAGIRIARGSCAGLALREDAIEVRLSSGDTLIFDTIYPCRITTTKQPCPNARCTHLEDGELIDARLATNVAGLYAVGDVLHGLDQVASACAQAAIAAAAIHNALRERDRSR
jgi:thioredoxin reductase (NADPH)